MGIAILGLLFFLPGARAEDLCQSPNALRAKVVYCHENIAYFDAGQACQSEYASLVSREQVRIKKALDAQVRAISNTAQKQDLQESGKVLSSTIKDLDYLIDYGKQVHTELEDYVYELVLPVFEDENAGGADVDNPGVKAEFRSRECYGPIAVDLEVLQAKLRPVIEDLEKTRAKAVSLAKTTGHYETNLGAASDSLVKVDGPKDSKPTKVPVRKGPKGSDISGTEKLKKKK
jgi:hypothetical protein